MKKPYFVKHRQELKPRLILWLTDEEKKSQETDFLGLDLLLVPTTEITLRLLSEVGNPIDVEIQTVRDV
jgi:hypothetical protein